MAKNDEVYYTPAGSPVLPDQFDVRVRLRSLSKGTLSYADLNKHLANLPDESAYADFRSYDAVTKDEHPEEPTTAGVTH